MSKRYIGIDIAGDRLHLAIAGGEKGAIGLERVVSWPLKEETDLTAILQEELGGTAGFGDRLAMALPVRNCYLRWLEFPFSDRKKIAAALELEMSGQLPVSTEGCLVVHRPAAGRVAAAAVPTAAVEQALAQFDESSWPVHILDLAPFAFADGLGGQLRDGLLIHAGDVETSVALIRAGEVADYRLLPAVPGQSPAEIAAFVKHQGRVLLAGTGETEATIYLIGRNADDPLVQAMNDLGLQLTLPRLAAREGAPSGAQLPAATLALRAAHQDREAGFNLRQGPYALRGEWQKLRRSLLAAAVLLVLVIGSFGASAWLSYAELSRQVAGLQKQMNQVFRQTFPGNEPLVDVPLQMQQKIDTLRNQAGHFGLTAQGSPLQVLKSISEEVPSELELNIRELSYAPDGVRLNGHTGSFDAVNQIARSLKQSPLFTDAKISDAKMSLDNTRVDFNLTLTFPTEVQR